MLKLINIEKFYSKNNQVAKGIENVNLDFRIGDFALIEGESGSGKSTLLNIISGKIFPTNGQMLFDGIDTNTFEENDWKSYKRNIISYVSQEYDLIYDMSVKNNILVGCFNKIDDSKIKYILELLKINTFIKKSVKYLSKGEAARVAIARELIKDNPIILVDEATANLDSENSNIIFKALKDVSDKKIIIIVSHKNEYDKNLCNRHIIINNNRVVEDYIIDDDKDETSIGFNQNDKSGLRLLKFTFSIKYKNKILNIISYTILLLLASILCFTIGSLSEKSIYNETDVFANICENRVILTKEDGTSFNDEDYNKLNEYGYDKIIKNDVLLDEIFDVEMNVNYIGVSTFFYNIDIVSNLKLENETIFTKSNEIIIGVKNGNVDLKEKYIRIKLPNSKNSFILEVAGFVESPNNTIYMNDEMMSFIYKDYVITNSIKKIFYDDNVLEKDINVYFNDSVDKNKVITNLQIANKLNVNISNNKYRGSINDLIIYDNFNVTNNYTFLDDEKYIIMNTIDYKSLVNDDKYQISLFLENLNERDLKNLEKHFLVYYPSIINDNSIDSTSVILELVYGTVIIGSLFVMMFIFIKSKNKFVEKNFREKWIYHRLGYKKQEIILCGIIEEVFNFACAIIISMLLCVIIKKSFLGKYIMEYYSINNYICLSILLAVIFLICQTKNYNKEFRKGKKL